MVETTIRQVTHYVIIGMRIHFMLAIVAFIMMQQEEGFNLGNSSHIYQSLVYLQTLDLAWLVCTPSHFLDNEEHSAQINIDHDALDA